jgi:hypothetical protein
VKLPKDRADQARLIAESVLRWQSGLPLREALAEELLACKDKTEIVAFVREFILDHPKLVDLFLKGKIGPLIGGILNASYDRLCAEDVILAVQKELVNGGDRNSPLARQGRTSLRQTC